MSMRERVGIDWGYWMQIDNYRALVFFNTRLEKIK